jgi:hypothetical protein
MVGFDAGRSSSRARRARGHPPGAHAGSVGAARRLRCAARPGRARHNSLRALRALRSNRCRESVVEARTVCAPRPGLRCSPTQKSPLPGAPCRDDHRRWCAPVGRPLSVPQRPVRVAGGAHRRASPDTSSPGDCSCLASGRAYRPGAARKARAPQGSCTRAQRASTTDLPHVFERSERSSRSELCGRPRDRGAQGSRCRRRRPPRLSAAGHPHGPLPAGTAKGGAPT